MRPPVLFHLPIASQDPGLLTPFFRLWVSPFYESGAANVPKLLELCESLSASLDGIDAMVILEGLKYGPHSFTSYILLLIVL